MEPVDRDYTPGPKELMYLGTEDQFYKIKLRDKNGNPVPMYLQPVPENPPAKPVTELSHKLAEATDQQEFYCVAFDKIEMDKQVWWESALCFAPGPSDYDDSSGSDEVDSTEPSASGSQTQGQTDSIGPSLELESGG